MTQLLERSVTVTVIGFTLLCQPHVSTCLVLSKRVHSQGDLRVYSILKAYFKCFLSQLWSTSTSRIVWTVEVFQQGGKKRFILRLPNTETQSHTCTHACTHTYTHVRKHACIHTRELQCINIIGYNMDHTLIRDTNIICT